uniref:Helicase ATP-binding domain-containing protein n=1 Tax=Setaria viridis TaxID=4556 RepID=A0A4U6WBU1_SETVI|nr:LOW QUALITY PROTEIN: hypothetical protein SEVIR_1G114200v2 [Setaria viridis]
MAGKDQRAVVLPVRALDGRTTTVRLPAAATVRDLKAALRASFPPAQAAPAFHLFLRGGKLILDAKLSKRSPQGLGRHGQIRHVQEISGREASFCPLPPHLSPHTMNALNAIGAEAIAAAVSGGRHVVVSTSTSSGKSLCYNVPVLESISPPSSTSCALYIFPTKALAQDQLKTLLEMTQGQSNNNNSHVSIYDGDTPMKDRAKIRDSARQLITNPDMLHMSILPSHAQFRRILSNLEYVVIDEAHSYKGAFGCHTALILRSHPKFIFCTATLANPKEHVMELAKLDDVELVNTDGSPCGAKHFLLWNPSVARAQERRPSPVQEVSYLFAEMVQHGLRCIAFCKTKKLCEMVLARTREVLDETSPELANSICVYRGGYVAEDRRRIEADLFGGKLRGVAMTNALELGIDVRPHRRDAAPRQAGRSGRRSKEPISVYVGFEGALDQYFMNFPQKLFGKPVEHCQVDSQNHKVLGQHLACAAFEKPLCVRKYVGPDNKSPSRTVSIRAIEHDRYKVIDKQGYRVLEEIEESKAFFQSDIALPPTSASSSKTGMVRTTAQANSCKVTTEWTCFDRIWKSNNVLSDSIEVDLPPYSFDTQAAWVTVPKSVRAAVEQRKLGFQGGVHAASHALLSIVPLHMMCSASDLGTWCADPQQTSKTPERILLYNKHPGGIGLASQVKLLFGELLIGALQLISTCTCTNLDGCPNCIQSFACSGYNKNLDEAAAVLILKGVIENERLYFYGKDGSQQS